jgi:hypothetical protein
MVLERKYNYWNRNDEDNKMPQNNVQHVVYYVTIWALVPWKSTK